MHAAHLAPWVNGVREISADELGMKLFDPNINYLNGGITCARKCYYDEIVMMVGFAKKCAWDVLASSHICGPEFDRSIYEHE